MRTNHYPNRDKYTLMSTESIVPELVVFDIAGTTVVDDGEVLRCFQEALAEEALEFPEEAINAVMGLPKIEAIRKLLAEFAPERTEPGLEWRLHQDFEQRMTEYYYDSPDVALYPGVAALFRKLRENGIAVAVNTGFPRTILDAVLERLGWRVGRTLDAAIASNEAPRGRPHADMIQVLMKRLGLDDPARVAKVGDTPSDIGEGKAAGCGWVVGVTHGTHTKDELKKCEPTHLVASMPELAKVWGLRISADELKD